MLRTPEYEYFIYFVCEACCAERVKKDAILKLLHKELQLCPGDIINTGLKGL